MPSPGAISSSTAVPSLTSVLNQGYMNLLCWEPGQKEYPEAGEVLGHFYSFFIKIYKMSKYRFCIFCRKNLADCPLCTMSHCTCFFPYVKQIRFFTKLKLPAARQLPSTQLHGDITALLHGLRSAYLSQLLFLHPQADLVSVHRHCLWIRPDCRGISAGESAYHHSCSPASHQ